MNNCLKLPSSHRNLVKFAFFLQLVFVYNLCTCKSYIESENSSKNEIVQFKDEKNDNKTAESIMNVPKKEPKFFDEFDCKYFFLYFSLYFASTLLFTIVFYFYNLQVK